MSKNLCSFPGVNRRIRLLATMMLKIKYSISAQYSVGWRKGEIGFCF